jgi:PKD repeat protein
VTTFRSSLATLVLLAAATALLLVPSLAPGASAPSPLPHLASDEPPVSGRAPSAVPFPSGPPANWLNLSGLLPTNPGPRLAASMTYDNASGAKFALLYGGGSLKPNGAEFLPDDVWTYTPAGGWTNITYTGAGGPGIIGRYGAMMTYDSTDQRVMLYGGCDVDYCPAPYIWSYGPTAGSFTVYNLALTGAGEPGGLIYGGFTDDPAQSGALLFGGCTALNSNGDCTAYSGNTYVVTWPQASVNPTFTQVTGPGPSARELMGMAWDPDLNGVLMYGGVNGHGLLNDTWLFSSDHWTNITGSANANAVPPPDGAATLVYNAESAHVVLFGGFGLPLGARDYTWSFGSSWANISSHLANAPSGRILLSGVSFPAPAFPMIYGGANETNGWQEDTWVLGPAPVVSTSVAPVTTDVNQNVGFAGWANGGLPPYTFTWNFGNGNTAASRYGNTTYTTPGTYTASLSVVDSYGLSAVKVVKVTVNALPTLAVAASPLNTTTILPVQFWGNVTGGSAPFNLTWDFGDGSIGYTASPAHLYLTPGMYLASSKVTDGAGQTAVAHVWINVTLAPFVIQASRSPGGGLAPFLVTFTASATGGSGTLTYSWAFGDGSAPSAGASASHTYTKLGLFRANVTVTDALGNTGVQSVLVWVFGPMSATAAASPNPVQTGNSSTVSVAASGGNGSYSYAWTVNGNTLPQVTSSFVWITSTPGNLTFNATITDPFGDSAKAQAILTVTSKTSGVGPLAVTLAANTTTSTVGRSVILSASPSGGFPPYSFEWYLNGSIIQTGTGSSYSYAFTGGGTYSFNVTAVDGHDQKAESGAVDVAVTYVGSPGGGTHGGGNPKSGGGGSLLSSLLSGTGLWVLLVILVLVVAIVGALLATRRRGPEETAVMSGEAVPAAGEWSEAPASASPEVGWHEPEPVSSPGPPVEGTATAAATAERPPHYVEFSRPAPRESTASGGTEAEAAAGTEEPVHVEEEPSAAEPSAATAEPAPSEEPPGETSAPVEPAPPEEAPAPAPAPTPAPEAEPTPPEVIPGDELSAESPAPEATPEPEPAAEEAPAAPAPTPAPKKRMKLKRKTPPSSG